MVRKVMIRAIVLFSMLIATACGSIGKAPRLYEGDFPGRGVYLVKMQGHSGTINGTFEYVFSNPAVEAAVLHNSYRLISDGLFYRVEQGLRTCSKWRIAESSRFLTMTSVERHWGYAIGFRHGKAQLLRRELYERYKFVRIKPSQGQDSRELRIIEEGTRSDEMQIRGANGQINLDLAQRQNRLADIFHCVQSKV